MFHLFGSSIVSRILYDLKEVISNARLGCAFLGLCLIVAVTAAISLNGKSGRPSDRSRSSLHIPAMSTNSKMTNPALDRLVVVKPLPWKNIADNSENIKIKHDSLHFGNSHNSPDFWDMPPLPPHDFDLSATGISSKRPDK